MAQAPEGIPREVRKGGNGASAEDQLSAPGVRKLSDIAVGVPTGDTKRQENVSPARHSSGPILQLSEELFV
ncbi:hypothetical protein PV325_001994 [Microctonus aethiopoides]|nr:hypothetical protein PV325_001994 [Microctonus aethiopoides]